MSIPAISTLVWGERTSFLNKRLAYVFSLDLRLAFEHLSVGIYCLERGVVARPRDRAVPTEGETPAPPTAPAGGGPIAVDHGSTFHVMDENEVASVDGTVHNVPSLAVSESGTEVIRLRENGAAEINGRLILEEPSRGAVGLPPTVLVEYRGIMNLGRDKSWIEKPNAGPWSPITGTSFIALRCDSADPRFRWLVISQLVGFGRVTAARLQPAKARRGRASTETALDYQYDLYVAG